MKVFLFLFIILLASGCRSIQFKSVYNSYSSEGFHARGIASIDSLLILTGAEGRITTFNLNSLSILDTFSIRASDLRGVVPSDSNAVLVMNSGDNGLLYRYDFGSKQNELVLSVDSAFFDAMAINDNGIGFLMGDPKNGAFLVYKTTDAGRNWVPLSNLPSPLIGEAGFAASNTGIAVLKETVYIGTGGGEKARLLKTENSGLTWESIITPMKSGDSYGIYSLNFWKPNEGMITGGSYIDNHDNDSICFLTSDGGTSWKNRSVGLPGYMSCITSTRDGKLIVVTGRLGAYYSQNRGKTWKILTEQPFYSVIIVNDLICLSGKKGSLAIYLKQQL